MNIQQGQAVEKTNILYSIDSILKPRLEMQQMEETRVEREMPAPPESSSPTASSDSLPTLGRYINVWA
jgi:hypothetical protein